MFDQATADDIGYEVFFNHGVSYDIAMASRSMVYLAIQNVVTVSSLSSTNETLVCVFRPPVARKYTLYCSTCRQTNLVLHDTVKCAIMSAGCAHLSASYAVKLLNRSRY